MYESYEVMQADFLCAPLLSLGEIRALLTKVVFVMGIGSATVCRQVPSRFSGLIECDCMRLSVNELRAARAGRPAPKLLRATRRAGIATNKLVDG